jgi:pilus assembly protein CpaB
MDRRFLTVLGVSLLFALVVASIFYQMSARGGRSQDEGDETDIVVAAAALPVGVAIKPSDVQLVKIQRDHFPQGAFGEVEEVFGRPVISNILLDEPIVEGRLGQRGTGFGLAPVIPDGMRAVAARVNEVVGVAGFVLPGMRVDVLVTLRLTGNAGARTTTVLQNILVLSAGEHIQTDGSGQAIDVPVVTLLVTPEQAEILTLAGSEGRIQLVLRNSGDRALEKTPGRDIAELYGRLKPKTPPRPKPRVVKLPPIPPPPPPPEPILEEIVVIRGVQKSVEVLGEDISN